MESTEEQNVTTIPEVEPVSTSVPPEDAGGETFLGWMRRVLMPDPAQQAETYQRRLAILDEAVAKHPQAISNYVLRGELHLDAGFYDLAVVDFQQALELGSQQFETERWGIIMQTMRDRAYEGLDRALRLRARENTWQIQSKSS